MQPESGKRPDANKILAGPGGVKALQAECEAEVLCAQKAKLNGDATIKPAGKGNGAGPAPFKFQIVRYKDIKSVLVGQWLIKRLLPANGLCVIYGPPGCGKSFLALHAVLHIASGSDYAGCAVRQDRVLYIAAEGQGGFGNRVKAAGKALEVPSTLQFDLLTVAPNLGREEGDAEQLIQEIKAQAKKEDAPLVAVVIDTVSRTMGGSDENSQGMQAFVNNAGNVARELDCLVIAVHHTGRDEGRGMRGWSGLHGACDAE